VIQLLRNVNFMARATKFSLLVKRFQVGLLVKSRFRLDQLAVHPLEERLVTHGKGVEFGLSDHVFPITTRAGDRFDGMTNGARDRSMGGRVVFHVEFRIVKGAAEKWHGIMATRTEARGMNIAIAFQEHIPGIFNTRKVCGIVERTEAMRRLCPTAVDIRVTLTTGIISHQSMGADELAIAGSGQGWFKVLITCCRGHSRRD